MVGDRTTAAANAHDAEPDLGEQAAIGAEAAQAERDP